jgi:hypothetical protein
MDSSEDDPLFVWPSLSHEFVNDDDCFFLSPLSAPNPWTPLSPVDSSGFDHLG